jgi:hypothetical protein
MEYNEIKAEKNHGNGTWVELKKKGRKILCRFSRRFRFLLGKVSIVHFQEAHERYWILWRDIEAVLHKNAHHIKNFKFREIRMEDTETPEGIADYFDATTERLRGLNSSTDSENKFIEKIIDVLPYYKILAKDRQLLSTSEKDLNTLWQDMNFIRIRLLNEVYSKDSDFDLALYLDFCREEARSMKVQDNPEIKELLHTAALDLVIEEEKTEVGKSRKNNEQTVRTISVILARLKGLRLKTFHEQLYKKNAYQGALLFLLPLAIILIYGHEIILAVPGGSFTEVAYGPSITLNEFPRLGLFEQFKALPLLPWMVTDWLVRSMSQNPLMFIFFAGLVGGFFSAVMKLRDNQGQLGEGAYYKWYVFTKPFVGALGAAILYIALKANFLQIKEIIGSNILTSILGSPIGAKGFTFGFIMGFSERIILPRLNKE